AGVAVMSVDDEATAGSLLAVRVNGAAPAAAKARLGERSGVREPKDWRARSAGLRVVGVGTEASRLGAGGWQHSCGVGSTEVVDVVVEGSGGWVAAVAVGVECGGGSVEPLDEGLDASFGGQFGDSVEGRPCAVKLAELQAGGEGV